MSAPIVLACLWVVAATVVAFLPLRLQVVFGFFLAVWALALVIWLSAAVSPWIGVAALAAFVSMFRKPLAYFAKRLLGRGGAG